MQTLAEHPTPEAETYIPGCSLDTPSGEPADHVELLVRLGDPANLSKTREALPLLLYVLGQAAQRQEKQVQVVLKDIASQLGISQGTLTGWHKKLVNAGVLRSVRGNGFITFSLAEPFQVAQRPMDADSHAYDAAIDNVLYADLQARVRRLELLARQGVA